MRVFLCGEEPVGNELQPLVGLDDGKTYVADGGRAVELAGRGDDATVAGQPLGAIPLVAIGYTHPQIEAAIRAINAQPDDFERFGQQRETPAVCRSLNFDVGVVVVRHGTSELNRSGDHEPSVLTNLGEVGHEFSVSGVEPTPHTSHVRALRQRVHSKYPGGTCLEDGAGTVDPRELGVALIGQDDHIIGSTPRRCGDQVVERAARVGWRVDPKTDRSSGVGGIDGCEVESSAGQQRNRNRPGVAQQRTHFVGRIGNGRIEDRVAIRTAQAQPLWGRRHELLGADAGCDFLVRVDTHSESSSEPSGDRAAIARRAERRRISALGIRRCQRTYDLGRRRIARRPDRQIDGATRKFGRQTTRLAETIMRIRRRDKSVRGQGSDATGAPKKPSIASYAALGEHPGNHLGPTIWLSVTVTFRSRLNDTVGRLRNVGATTCAAGAGNRTTRPSNGEHRHGMGVAWPPRTAVENRRATASNSRLAIAFPRLLPGRSGPVPFARGGASSIVHEAPRRVLARPRRCLVCAMRSASHSKRLPNGSYQQSSATATNGAEMRRNQRSGPTCPRHRVRVTISTAPRCRLRSRGIPMTEGNGSMSNATDFDVVVVGAGFSGLYLLYRLRKAGFTARVMETADDVGGTWYWNRYPGARCDIPTTDYSYTFDPDLEKEWTWSEKYATQPEILRYLQHVTAKHDLRRDISFSTRIASAVWDEPASLWRLTTGEGKAVTCRYYVMATGCLSLPKDLDIAGADQFKGKVYFTSRWPHEGVDFTGQRVGVIGTGSSGIQSIPIIASQASALTVFQRTPNFSIPANNGAPSAERLAHLQADRAAYRHEAKYSVAGVTMPVTEISGVAAPEDVRRARFEAAWQSGELLEMGGVFNDILVNKESNDIVAEMIREKIRATVKDPETAEALCPKDFPVATKRLCLDTNYFQTYNLPHVRLVDLRKNPIKTVTATGLDTPTESFEFDAIVYATGFDAMTGAIVAVDITGRDGVTLKQKWADGPTTYLGLTTVGFPNFFAVTGPGSPSVLSNMTVSIEQHVDWVADTLEHLRAKGFETIEPTPTAEAGWVQHVNDCGDITLFPSANSWYMGANVPGKPRVFLPYVGGVGVYRQTCEKVVEQGYLGFALEGPAGKQLNDGVINRLQPDVAMVLELMAGMGLPPLESMSVEDARAFMAASSSVRPPGPEVGEIIDGMLPGAAGELEYRLYRPATPGPHPIVAYFHGGGWVLGSQDSDDPLCRDLCVRSNAIFVSVNYRHAPEARFPAAVDDGYAATKWIADHASELGGIPGQLVVAGWSAGGNVAAVAAQMARDLGGPTIVGQLLLTPVTDCDFGRGSFTENGDGYVLTQPLMKWFWDHYADAADRTDPRASPLRAKDLSALAPAVIITAEFDPLRDEGDAYAEALAQAGVRVQHIPARGHTHTTVAMVDVVISGAPVRDEMGRALRSLFGASVPA